MRRTMTLAAAICLSISVFAAPKTRKAVYIILDGVPADIVERLELPAISEIASRGAYGRSYVGGTIGRYDQTPTISAVGYTDLLTATWVNKHNVPGNSDLSPNYNYWTIFRIAKEQERDVKTALYSSWTDNRTVLIGEGKEETGHLRIDFVCDGYDNDAEAFKTKENELRIFDIDEHVSKLAAKGIREDAPDLSWVYLWYTDDAGHLFGNGDFLDESVRLGDRQVQRIWDAVKYREANFNEEWMIVVTTDHGRTYDGYHHGGQSERERVTWVATNQKVNKRMKSGKSAIVDIVPSICKFMGFTIPDDVRREQDGVSFYGETDIMDMDLMPQDSTVRLSWTSLNKKAAVEIYACPTNDFKTGGKDIWIKVGEARAKDECHVVDMTKLPKSRFYKFLLETPNCSLNRWYILDQEKYTNFKFPLSYYEE